MTHNIREYCVAVDSMHTLYRRSLRSLQKILMHNGCVLNETALVHKHLQGYWFKYVADGTRGVKLALGLLVITTLLIFCALEQDA